MTKNLTSGEKRTKFCEMLLHFLKPSNEIGEEANLHAQRTPIIGERRKKEKEEKKILYVVVRSR